MLEINAPDVVAEVTACCEAYERALVINDVEALRSFFWDSPLTIRFGMAEQLYGAAEIDEFRKNRVINFTGRTPLRLTVLALGRDVAVATLEFHATVAGQQRHGRQTQVWARFPDGDWRVTSAHVSRVIAPAPDPAEAHVDAAALAVFGRPMASEFRPGVVRNLQVAASLAAPLMAYPLPSDAEPAPVFAP